MEEVKGGRWHNPALLENFTDHRGRDEAKQQMSKRLQNSSSIPQSLRHIAEFVHRTGSASLPFSHQTI